MAVKTKSAKIKNQSYDVAVTGLLLVVVLLLLFLVPQPEDKVVFLDVGQGDAILLQDGTRQVLVDGGPGMTVLTRLGEEMPWFDRRIEVIVLTHPQRDHMEGLLHILDRYKVGMVLIPKLAHTSQMQEAWLERIIDRGIDYRFALNHVGFRAGLGQGARQRIIVGDIVLTILAPFDNEAARAAARANLNNISVVTRVDFGDLSFLLTGDIEKRVEKILVEEYGSGLTPQSPPAGGAAGLRVDVLKVGHHGSKTSTSSVLLAATSPAAAVVSVGADNKFGHPHLDVLKRLGDVSVWRTDEVGSVRFKLADVEKWIIDVDG